MTNNSSEAVPLKEHLLALRQADDRRYAEVNIEREKALKIKEEADKAALGLAREIQNYKDEKANELREQINSERGLYVTNKDFEVVKAFMAAQAGRITGFTDLRTILSFLAGLAIAATAMWVAFRP